MNKEQIEEMAFAICKSRGVADVDACKKCWQYEIGCLYREIAGGLYAADYCKRSKWISVEERLPDNHRRVLIACEGTTIGGATSIAIGSYGGGFWAIADADGTAYLTKYMHIVVTHWMPLPEPPKTKGGAE